MSELASAVSTRQDEGEPPSGEHRLLCRVRRVGYVVLGVQLVVFLVWSAILYSRFAVTFDFAAYYQPWFLIAHGHLNPYSTIMGVPFWQNDSEFLLWALAPIYWITRSGLTLPWLQDVSVVAAEAVAFTWVCELVRQRCRDRDAAWLGGLGLLLLVANPWICWAVSFDAHQEVLCIVFVVLMAWDLSQGRRRAWFWIVPVFAAGAASATYVVGIGLGGVLAGRRSRRMGAGMVLLGLGYSLFVVLIHGDGLVSIPRMYGYLAVPGGHTQRNLTLLGLVEGIAGHPLGLLGVLWAKRADMIANLAPGGLLGFGAPIVLPLMVVVLLANCLVPGYQFAEPLHQNIPVYVLVPVGTVAVLCWLLPRHRRLALALAGLAAAQVLGWAAVWGPRIPGQWLRVPAPAAAALTGVEARIPASAEVIVSQGVIGRFSDRTRIYGLLGPIAIPVRGLTWVVITPTAGIEAASVATSMALIGELAGPLHATLVTHGNGVWAFRWTPPASTRQIVPPGGQSPLPAWAAAATAGRPVLDGPVSGWHMAATGTRGYVSDGLEWQEPAGRYLADVALAANGPVNVEVWDDTTSTLLARRTVPSTSGIEQVAMPVSVPDAPDATAYAGWGPFRADFNLPPAGQRTEVRVWSPGGTAVDVYSAYLSPAVGPVPGWPGASRRAPFR